MRPSLVLAIAILLVSAAHGDEPSLTDAITAEFRSGLARHNIADAYAAHCKYSLGKFEASRGTATYSDKTGNCRLPWVEKLVTAPGDSVGEADRFSRELFAAASKPDGWPQLLAAAAVRLDVTETPQTAPAAPPDDVLQQVAAVLAVTRTSWDAALAPLTAEEQTELRAGLYRQSTGDLDLGHRFVDQQQGRRMSDLFDRLDRTQIWQAARDLTALTNPQLIERLGKVAAQTVPAKPGVQGALWRWIDTPKGAIVVGGQEANKYSLDEMAGVAAVIDLGGDDTYIEGTTSAERPVLVVIDLEGNDTYRGERPGIQGAAVMGVSLLADLAGDDRYSAKDIAQGAALAGVGILIDTAGNDKYVGDRRVQGQAIAGCGILLDRAGNDDYRAALLAQGVGGPRGFGLLADLAGGDHYFAGGKYPGGYDDTPGFGSWSQGVGVGPRGVANGGVGVILDGGGDDMYEADYFSHGGGYWFAAGIVHDFGGNDQRIGATREHFDGSPRTEQRFVRWGTGYGCHFAAGFVFDDSGNDSYIADFAVIGYAWDIAIGAVCDWQGDDKYIAAGSGVAQAHNAAVALIYDRAGSDQYQGGVGATTKETPYHPEASGNYTLILDEAGTDQYPAGINNGQETDRGWPGARVVDREEKLGSDWPKFEGPLGNGSSPETGLLRKWPETGPSVLWRIPIKQGWGCPSVVGEDLYLCATEAPRGNSEIVLCLDAATGAERWRHTYEVGPYWERNIGWARGGFRATPAVTGDGVYTLGAIGHFHCLDRHTGKVLWHKNLWDEWNPSGEKGYVFSPVFAEGKLVLWYSDGASSVTTPDQHEVVCQALDPTSGEVLWTFREPHREPSRMGEGQTPAVARFGADPCIVGTANCELKAIRIADGREVWKFECIRRDGRGTTTPPPLVLDRYLVNIPDLDTTHVVEYAREQPGSVAKMLWKKDLNIFTPIHQFRHRDGYLFGFAGQIRGDDEQAASDSTLKLVCLELATGKLIWSEPGFKTGVSMIEADGLLFVRSYQTLRLVEATPAEYRLLGEVHTHDTWQPTINLTDFVMPVLSRGRLLIRTPTELICYLVRGH